MNPFKNYLDEKKIAWVELSNTTILVTKWNWPYAEALEAQKMAIQFVKENPKEKVLFFCNHPHVYTLGRGLQKSGGKVLPDLVDFSEDDKLKLGFELFKINRGGGLTFHCPSQWIIYPIINLNIQAWSLSKHYHWILGETTKALQHLGIKSCHYDIGHAGIWNEGSKLGSIGVGIERFVTCHGLALNVLEDNVMMNDFSKTNPCGLRPTIYKSVDQFLPNAISVEEFNEVVKAKTDLLKQEIF